MIKAQLGSFKFILLLEVILGFYFILLFFFFPQLRFLSIYLSDLTKR